MSEDGDADKDSDVDAGDQFGGKNSKKKSKHWQLGRCGYTRDKVLINTLFEYYHSKTMSISQSRCSVRRLQRISSTPRILSISESKSTKVKYGRCELDSYAYTIVAASNCVILGYTGQVCDVSEYREDYEPVKDVPIVQAAITWQSQHTEQTYILVFNEALWMGDTMDHTLINPNQRRHYGTIIHAETHSPTEKKLYLCTMVQLTSEHL